MAQWARKVLCRSFFYAPYKKNLSFIHSKWNMSMAQNHVCFPSSDLNGRNLWHTSYFKWHKMFMHFPFNGYPASNLMGSNYLWFPLNSYPVPNLTAYNCVHVSLNDNPASDCPASRIPSHHFPHPRVQTESSHQNWTPSLPAVRSAMSQRLLG